MDLSQAREIAYLWHGGQSTELYSFASTGEVFNQENLVWEIEREIRLLEKDTRNYSEAEKTEGLEDLAWLWKFAREYNEENE